MCVALVAIAGRRYTYTVCTSISKAVPVPIILSTSREVQVAGGVVGRYTAHRDVLYTVQSVSKPYSLYIVTSIVSPARLTQYRRGHAALDYKGSARLQRRAPLP